MPNLPGPKIPFYAPFPASKRAREDLSAATLDRQFARVLCKDAIGLFLGLVPAPYRISRFDDKPGGTVAGNNGRRFAINEQVSANPFKFFLIPGTQIEGAKVNFSTGAVPVRRLYPVKSISVWMPGHVTINQVLFWINGLLNGYTEGGVSRILPTVQNGQPRATTEANLKRILAVVTPNERKYNVRTVMIPDARPMIDPITTPTPSPTPSPTPTP